MYICIHLYRLYRASLSAFACETPPMCVRVCVCVCACLKGGREREREREKESREIF